MKVKDRFLTFFGLSLLVSAPIPFLSQSAHGPAVQTTEVKRNYLVNAESVREVDFKNFWYDVNRAPDDFAFRLQNGKYSDQEELGGDEIELTSVKYFRSNKLGPEIALVEIYWTSWGGSSSQDCHLFVFRVD